MWRLDAPFRCTFLFATRRPLATQLQLGPRATGQWLCPLLFSIQDQSMLGLQIDWLSHCYLWGIDGKIILFGCFCVSSFLLCDHILSCAIFSRTNINHMNVSVQYFDENEEAARQSRRLKFIAGYDFQYPLDQCRWTYTVTWICIFFVHTGEHSYLRMQW